MTAPRRRWFQFSLRTLLVALTLALVLLGHEVNCWRQHRQDVETLTQAGATVGVASWLPAGVSRLLPAGYGEHVCVIIWSENSTGSIVDWEPSRPDEPITDIEAYFLMNVGRGGGGATGAVSADAFAAIKRCRQLKALSLLGDKTVDDEQARMLAELPRLGFLNLGCSPLTADTVALLLASPQLRFFRLDNGDLQIQRDRRSP